MFLDTPISHLPRTASITIKRLDSLGVKTYLDLLNIFPNRYADYHKKLSLQDLFNVKKSPLFENPEKDRFTIRGTVTSFKNQYTRRGFKIQKAVLTDGTASTEIVWFNQQYLATIIKEGMLLQVSGFIKETGDFQPEEYEVIPSGEAKSIHSGRIIPVYPEKRGMSSRTLRDKIFYILSHPDFTIAEMLPEKMLKAHDLISENEAYRQIHFPDSFGQEESARRRLSFDELFVIQLTSLLVRQKWQQQKIRKALKVDEFTDKMSAFIDSLPFELTPPQKKVISEISADLKRTTPMNRLLQGDVGSGKTVVASAACLLMTLNNERTLLMAPTEILARQHFQTLQKLFPVNPRVALCTGSSKLTKKMIEETDIFVGTHALLFQRDLPPNIGLIIVDEQHKFGVAQRSKLKEKGITPHLLTMTATPIPRTVMLTLYGELDLSIIDQMPKNRLPIKSYVVSKDKRNDAYQWIKKLVVEKRQQAFIVCPLIEESESESMKNIKAASAEFDKLKKTFFKDIKLGLLHGRMKAAEKETIMKSFNSGEIDVLVSTPVVEVGIDVPNATIIVIEAAERFGLSQLHQLRGRVGRGDAQSYCLLFTDNDNFPTQKRLRFFSKVSNGFELAEYDLKARGAGQLYGVRQHGENELKIAVLTDLTLIKKTHEAAINFVEEKLSLEDYPLLKHQLEVHEFRHIAKD